VSPYPARVIEEADLTTVHGEKYWRYREQAPMVVPALGKAARVEIKAS